MVAPSTTAPDIVAAARRWADGRHMEHNWARDYRDRPGVYVVDEGTEIVQHLERLYADELTLIA